MNKKLTVIIDNIKNNEKINDTLESLEKQTYRDIDIVILSDIDKYEDHIKYIDVSTMDKLSAYYKGIEEAESNFVAFLSAGNKVTIDYYRNMIRSAISNDSDIVFSNYMEEEADGCFVYNLLEVPENTLKGLECFTKYFKQEGLNNNWNFIDNKIFSKKLCLDVIKSKHENKSNNILLLLFDLFLNSNCVTKIDNDYLVKRIDYTLDGTSSEVIDDFKYIEEVLKERNYYNEFENNLNNWKNNYCQKYKNTKEFDALKKWYPNYKDNENENYYTLVKTKWNNGLEKIKEQIKDEKIKMVSFDIFDTLVVRPFLVPTDLFNVLDKTYRELTNNNSALDFKKARVDSELCARKYKQKSNPNSQDVTLDEIYDALKKRYKLDDKMIEVLKAKEIELEIRFCNVRNTGFDLYSLSKYLNKIVVCTSDMYLSKDTISSILKKNGYTELDNLYVSSMLDITKASGDLFDFVLEQNHVKASEALHIGDNTVSDYKNPIDRGLNACLLPQALNVFNDTNYTKGLSMIYNAQMPFWHDNVMSKLFNGVGTLIAMTANKYFDNPFVSFNEKTDFNSNPYLIGYYCLGSLMFGVNKWMLDDTNGKYDKIAFMARDGYLPMKCFDVMKECYDKAPESVYFYVSRKSLLPLLLRNNKDFYKVSELVNIYNITPLGLAKYFEDVITMDEKKFIDLCKEKKISANKKMRDLDDFNDVVDIIVDNFIDDNKRNNYMKLLKEYFNEIFEGKVSTFDIGYSARPSYYISNLLEKPIDTYFCNISASEAFRHAKLGGFKLNIFFDGKPVTIGHAYEMLISAMAPSCKKYSIVDGKIEPEFGSYESESTLEYGINTVQGAALDLIKDITLIFGSDIDILDFQNFNISLPFMAYLMSSKEIDKYFLSSVIFEDDLNIDSNTKMIKIWQEDLMRKNQYPITSLANGSYEKDEGMLKTSLVYNSNIDLSKKNKVLRLLFYILYDRDTLKRRMNEIKVDIRKKKKLKK